MSLGQKPVFWQDFAKNYMKIKGIGPRGGRASLDPSMAVATRFHVSGSGSVTTMMLQAVCNGEKSEDLVILYWFLFK